MKYLTFINAFIVFFCKYHCLSSKDLECEAYGCIDQVKDVILHYSKDSGDSTIYQKYRARYYNFYTDWQRKNGCHMSQTDPFFKCVEQQIKEDLLDELCLFSNNINPNTCLIDILPKDNDRSSRIYDCIYNRYGHLEGRSFNKIYNTINYYSQKFQNMSIFNYNLPTLKKITCLFIKDFEMSIVNQHPETFVTFIDKTLNDKILDIFLKEGIITGPRSSSFFHFQAKENTVLIYAHINCIYTLYFDFLNKKIEKNPLQDECPIIQDTDFELESLLLGLYPYREIPEKELQKLLGGKENSDTLTDETSETPIDENSKIPINENSKIQIDENSKIPPEENSKILTDEYYNITTGKQSYLSISEPIKEQVRKINTLAIILPIVFIAIILAIIPGILYKKKIANRLNQKKNNAKSDQAP